MTRRLPREIVPGIFWITDCLVLAQRDDSLLHAYHSAYLVAGDRSSLIVDSGHPKDWRSLEVQIDEVMATGVAGVKYVFLTHAEVPHSANLGRLLTKFPDAVAVGDVRDYHVVFPEFTDRMVGVRVGDRLDLGGTDFVIMRAIVRDLVTSLWAYDTRRRTLFPGDGFAYMHHHREDECGNTAEELPDLPIPEFTAVFAEAALYWTRFTDIEPKITELEALLAGSEYPIEAIAPGHGCPIMSPAVTAPKVTAGMRMGSSLASVPGAAGMSGVDGHSRA